MAYATLVDTHLVHAHGAAEALGQVAQFTHGALAGSLGCRHLGPLFCCFPRQGIVFAQLTQQGAALKQRGHLGGG